MPATLLPPMDFPTESSTGKWEKVEDRRRKDNKTPCEKKFNGFLLLFSSQENKVMTSAFNNMHFALHRFSEGKSGDPQKICMDPVTLPTAHLTGCPCECRFGSNFK